MLIDSPYLPDELDALPSLLAGAGFEPDGLLATHADFDHLLGRLAFPGMTLGAGRELRGAPAARAGRRPARAARVRRGVLRGPPGAARPRSGPGAAGARARRDRRPRAGAAPGRGPHGRRDGAVRPRAGPAGRGRLPLGRGDPWISRGGSLGDYRATLARLAPLVEAADDRGARPRLARTTATRRCASSTRTWTTWTRSSGGEQQPLPEGRDSKAQREIHAENLTRV